MKWYVHRVWSKLVNLQMTALTVLLLMSCSGGGGQSAPATTTPVTPPTVTPATSVSLTQVVGGFASPVAITGAGDGSGRLFVVEQGGSSGSCETVPSCPGRS